MIVLTELRASTASGGPAPELCRWGLLVAQGPPWVNRPLACAWNAPAGAGGRRCWLSAAPALPSERRGPAIFPCLGCGYLQNLNILVIGCVTAFFPSQVFHFFKDTVTTFRKRFERLQVSSQGCSHPSSSSLSSAMDHGPCPRPLAVTASPAPGLLLHPGLPLCLWFTRERP